MIETLRLERGNSGNKTTDYVGDMGSRPFRGTGRVSFAINVAKKEIRIRYAAEMYRAFTLIGVHRKLSISKLVDSGLAFEKSLL